MRDYEQNPIYAFTEYSRRELKEFQKVHSTQTRRICMAMMVMLAGTTGLLLAVSASSGQKPEWRGLGLLGGLFVFFLFLYLAARGTFYSEKRHAKQKKFFENGQRYTFRASLFTAENKNAHHSGQSHTSYDLLHRVLETDKMFYLYLNRMQAYLVSKEGISNAAPEELAEILRAHTKPRKYKRKSR